MAKVLIQRHYRLVLMAFIAWGFVGCGGNPTTSGGGSPSSQFGIEKSYCSGTSSVSGGVTITSTATFDRYEDGASGLISTANYSIRYAEIEILNESGSVIQCGETDVNGNISINIPKVAGTYSLRVNSRADNSHYKVSILNNPTSKTLYSISSNFTLTGSESSKSVPLTPAPYNGNLEGGAFNILDQVYVINEYLRNNSTCSGCTTFTVAPKVEVFWTKGLSPAAYFNEPSVGVSFFSSTSGGNIARGIYILGGIQGSLCNDTDHFDNSVLLHEYGHFLEDAYSQSASPGGSHNGNSVIDPRLAWSEGWADFIQAAVLGRRVYRDTYSNAECGNPSLSFSDFNLENKVSTDVPTANGEGVFREISIARTLFDSVETSSTDTDGRYASLDFALIWDTFSSSAFASTSSAFQNSGLFHENLSSTVSSLAPSQVTNYNDILTYEYQSADEQYYGLNLTAQVSGSCTFTFNAGTPVAYTGSNSYFHRSNKFFEYYYDGSASNATIKLRYSGTSPYDLDLYVYGQDHDVSFSSNDSVVKSSALTYPESAGVGLESISLSGQAAGIYMINVRVKYTGAKTTTTLYLENNSGDRLCP